MSTAESPHVGEMPAGVMSEGELRFLEQIQGLIRVTLEGRVPFYVAMQSLSDDLTAIRQHGFDVDAAFASGSIRSVATTTLPGSAPARVHVTESEVAFLRDLAGLIDYATRNGVSYWTILKPIAHDIRGLAAYEWSVEKALADYFLPAVSGWAKRNEEPTGQAEEVSD